MSLSYQELIASVLLNLGTVEGGGKGNKAPYDCAPLGDFAHCISIQDYYPSEALLSWEAQMFNQPHLDFNPIGNFMEEHDDTMPEEMARKLVIYPPIDRGNWGIHSSKVDQSCVDFLAAEYDMAQGLWMFAGIRLRPLDVPPDGSCFTHSLSVATTGSHVFFDALRYAIFKELREHRCHYTSMGTHAFMSQYKTSFQLLKSRAVNNSDSKAEGVLEAALDGLEKLDPSPVHDGSETKSSMETADGDQPLYTEAMWCEAVREAAPSAGHRLPPNRHLSELHWVAAANVLKRSLLVIARHDDQSATLLKELVVPTRMTLEEVEKQDKMAPLIVLYKCNHYVPMVLEEDFWAWASQTTTMPNDEELPALDEACLNALRAYQQESRRDRSLFEGIPLWVESYVMRALADADAVIRKALEDDVDLSPARRHEIHACFGDPLAVAGVPPQYFPESVPLDRFYVTASSQAYLDFFRALHIQIVHIHNATKAYLVVHPREVDFKVVRKLILALRILFKMSLPVTEEGCISSVPGVVDLEEDVLGEFFSSLRVCGFDTFTETDPERLAYKQAVNKGLRQMYLGNTIDLNTLRDPRRKPKEWMVGEVNKIKAKYNKYIHLDWDRVVEDEAKRVHTVGDLRQAFQSLPRSIVALQYALLHESYPGSGRLTYSQVVLQDYHDRDRMDRTLADVTLETPDDRSKLLRQLLQRYGLPVTGPGFESAAMSVCLPETHDEQRTRSAFLNWIEGHRDTYQESRGGNNVLIDYMDDSKTVVSKITLVPSAEQLPLMELAFLSTMAARSNPPLPPTAPSTTITAASKQQPLTFGRMEPPGKSNSALVTHVLAPRRMSSGEHHRHPVLRVSGGGRDADAGLATCPPSVCRSRSEGARPSSFQPFLPRGGRVPI